MPAELTTPIDINTNAPNVTAEISIQEITIRVPKGDDPGGMSLVIAKGDGENSWRVPGSFSVTDNPSDPTLQEQVAGVLFQIPVGLPFTNAAAAAPVGDSVHDAIKDACYKALFSRFPSLSGVVS